MRTTNGIAISARTAGAPAQSFEGTDADLDKLMQQAAESIFKATQPYRYATMLSRQHRIDEARAVYQELADHGSDEDRPWAHSGLGNVARMLGNLRESLNHFLAAEAADPHFPNAWVGAGIADMAFGYDEQAFTSLRRAEELTRSRNHNLSQAGVVSVRALALAMLAPLQGDYLAAATQNAALFRMPNFTTNSSPGYLCGEADNLALAHDIEGARRVVADAGMAGDAGFVAAVATGGALCLPNFDIAAETGDWQAALADIVAADAAVTNAGALLADQRMR